VLIPSSNEGTAPEGPIHCWTRLGALLPYDYRDAASALWVYEKEQVSMAEQSYVEHREGVYRVAGTRVSLDSIVYAFLDGHTAESIQQSFPVLTLEQVYGAITYYLAHREAIEAYLREQEAVFDTLKETLRQNNPQMAKRIDAIKQQYQTTRP
jgi:uncharacterized protein (DUF433 family)